MASLLDYLNANAGANSVPAPAASPGAAPSPLQALIAQVNAPANNASPAQAAQYAGSSDDTTPVPLAADPNAAPTAVDGIDVTAAKPQMNYDNTKAQAGVNTALNKEAAAQTQEDQQPDARNGPTSYGILPQSMQHGTLSKVLGLLGDAYLVHHGRAPAYLQGQQAVQESNALAGYDPNNAEPAIQRLTATGIPGAIGESSTLRQAAATQALAKQAQINTQLYHQSTIDAKNENTIRGFIPQMTGLANIAPDLATYTQRYNQAENLAQKIDPKYHATDLGLVPPEQWSPGMHLGLTGNQQQQSTDRAAGRAQTETNTRINAGARVQAAGLSAARPLPAQNLSQSDANLINRYEQGAPLNQSEQNRVAHLNNNGRGGAGHLAITGGGQAAPQGGGGLQPGTMHQGYPVFTPQQLQAAAQNPANRGKKFYGTDGQQRVIH